MRHFLAILAPEVSMRARLLLFLPLLCACSRDHRTDLQKLSDFHKQMTAIDHRVAAASDTYTKASKAALAAGNRAGVYSAADALRLAMVSLQPMAQGLRVPDFTDSNVGNDAGQAQSALVAEISDWADAAAALRAVYDPRQPSPAQAGVAAQAEDQANSDAVEEGSEIMQAYDDLGVSPDRVDTQNGGLRNR
jgi:hypothetical protein